MLRSDKTKEGTREGGGGRDEVTGNQTTSLIYYCLHVTMISISTTNPAYSPSDFLHHQTRPG